MTFTLAETPVGAIFSMTARADTFKWRRASVRENVSLQFCLGSELSHDNETGSEAALILIVFTGMQSAHG